MEGIFTEFENENSLRTYPFAACCVPASDAKIPSDLFVDAVLYPVNPSGSVYLSSVSADGVFSVSDETGVIMSGTASGSVVELYDGTALSRHVGTLVASSAGALSDFAGRGAEMRFDSSSAAFAASCVLPVVIDGVTSVSVGGAGTAAGVVGFANGPDDEVRVSSGIDSDGRSTLRFDVVPRIAVDETASIRRIICVVDGKTPFRISRHQASYNTVVLTLDNIDKEVVCSAAHRENDYEMADTCSCKDSSKRPGHVDIPEHYDCVEVFVPPTPEREEGAENAFYLVVPNLLNYENPLSITLEDGVVAPRIAEPEIAVDGYTADLAEPLVDDVTSKGVVIQVPGLSGGAI